MKESGGNLPLAVKVRDDLREGLRRFAIEDRRTISACMELMLHQYLDEADLPPMSGKKVLLPVTGAYRTRRYFLGKEAIDRINEADSKGYSKSYIIEQALMRGLRVSPDSSKDLDTPPVHA